MTWAGSAGTQVSPLDPGTASDQTSIQLISMIYDGLVVLDQNEHVEKWGADNYTVSADGLTYTFHVRPGQMFSDGTPVHASDYVYGIMRSEDPCFVQAAQPSVNAYLDNTVAGAAAYTDPSNCVNGHAKHPLTSVVADDSAGTVTITLARPYGFFLDALTYSTSYALEQKVVTGANFGADEKWVANISQGPTGQGGSGMFYVSSYDAAGNLVLKANPNWWGINAGKKPHLTEIDVQIFANADTGYAAYNTGTQFDLEPGEIGVPPAQLPAARGQADFHQNPWLSIQGVQMNWHMPPFDDVNARKGFCLAINRDDITQNVTKGGQVPSWHIIPQGMDGYNPNVTGPDGVTATAGDLTKAQADWAAYKAAHPGAHPKIQYTVDTQSSLGKALADKLVAVWNQAFPDANVQENVVDFHTRVTLENHKLLQFLRFGWGDDYPDPQDFTTLLFDTNSAYNLVYASVPAADQLMEKADVEPSGPQRWSDYDAAEQLLINNVAYCPIYQYEGHYRVRTFVHNYAENSSAVISMDQLAEVYLTNS
jgi:peptide/nickel transport system substrate-binding protein/oligopeptide transport system substrate-binding protein